VGHQIFLEEPRPYIGPFGNARMGIWRLSSVAFEQRASLGRADTTPHLRLVAQRLERAIHRGRTHAGDTRLHRDRKLT
jgi:hypothetical protein